jgi:hypothetical protein
MLDEHRDAWLAADWGTRILMDEVRLVDMMELHRILDHFVACGRFSDEAPYRGRLRVFTDRLWR